MAISEMNTSVTLTLPDEVLNRATAWAARVGRPVEAILTDLIVTWIDSLDPDMASDVRNASEYDVYIPLNYNDGTPIESEKIAVLKQRLHDRFGGLTFFPQRNEGTWRVGKAEFRDDVVICRIVTEQVRQSRLFFLRLKEEMKQEFRQEEVLIVERKVEIL